MFTDGGGGRVDMRDCKCRSNGENSNARAEEILQLSLSRWTFYDTRIKVFTCAEHMYPIVRGCLLVFQMLCVQAKPAAAGGRAEEVAVWLREHR